MGKDYEVEIEALISLSKDYKRYGQSVYSKYKSGASRIDSELNSILRKYSDYSSVTSKVYSLQSKLREAEQEIRQLQDKSNKISNGLKGAASLYLEDEREAKQLITRNKLKANTINDSIKSSHTEFKTMPILKGMNEFSILKGTSIKDYEGVEGIVIESTSLFLSSVGSHLASTGKVTIEGLLNQLAQCETINIDSLRETSNTFWNEVGEFFGKLGTWLKEAGSVVLKVIGSIACGLIDWCAQFLLGTMELICYVGMFIEEILYLGQPHGMGFFETGLNGIKDISKQVKTFYEELAPYKELFEVAEIVASVVMITKTIQEVVPQLPTLLKSLPQAIKNIPQAIDDILNTLRNSPDLLNTVMEALRGGAGGGLALEGVGGSVGQTMQGSLGAKIVDVLTDVIEGVGAVVMEAEGAVVQAIQTVVAAEILAEGVSAITGGGGPSSNEGASKPGITANDVQFSDKFLKPAYKNQVAKRGWTNETIADTINNPLKTGITTNKYTGNTVTVYYCDDVHYVAVDNGTGKVIQVADLSKPNWELDLNR